jgi:hypothetical protein
VLKSLLVFIASGCKREDRVLEGVDNAFRPHSSLDDLTLRKFAEQYAKPNGNHSRFFLSLAGTKTGESQLIGKQKLDL